MKNQRGITLIALIITIIVMMILVAVTVTFTIGENGILKNVKEAKFKQEVSQLLEFVNMEKAAIIAEHRGTLPQGYSFDVDTLKQSIPRDLKGKYIETGKLLVAENGEIYYDSRKVTTEEATWLYELGIEQDPGSLTFKEKVTLMGQDEDNKIEQYINMPDVIDKVEAEEENAMCFAIIKTDSTYAVWSVDDIKDTFRYIEGPYEILKVAEKANLGDNYPIPNTTDPNTVSDPNVKEIIRLGNEYNIINTFKGNKLSVVRTMYNSNSWVLEQDFKLYIYKDQDKLVMDSTGGVEDDKNGLIIMTESETTDFVFEELDLNVGNASAVAISSYKGIRGANENLEIPSIIFNDQGDISKVVIQISTNAFEKPTLIPLPMVFEWENDEYLDTKTVEDVYQQLFPGEEYPGTEEEDNSKDVNAKNAILFNALGEFELTEEDLEIAGDGIPYIYFDMEEEVPLNKPATIKSITIPSTIVFIEDNAFTGRLLLEKINYYKPLIRPSIASNAFAGCDNLLEIRFLNSEWPMFEEPISGYETYWGAPNENVKIYDKNGEI